VRRKAFLKKVILHIFQAQLRIPSGQAIFLIKSPEQTNLNYIEIGGTEQCALTLEVNDFHGLYSQM
jgi:hypothetical protein